MIDDLGRIRAVVDDVDLHFSRWSGSVMFHLGLRVQAIGQCQVPLFQIAKDENSIIKSWTT